MSSNGDPDFTLYSSTVSNASTRLRIALNLKKLSYKLINIKLSKGEQHDPAFLARSPCGTVPLLIHRHNDHVSDTIIGQSIAAIEYLEEAFPETTRLLPQNANARAKVRTLVALVASDTHPLLTHRVSKAICEIYPAADIMTWHKHWLSEGFRKFEGMLDDNGRYCVGDEITFADVVLMPEVWYARRIGVNMSMFSKINDVCEKLSEIEEVRKEEQKAE